MHANALIQFILLAALGVLIIYRTYSYRSKLDREVVLRFGIGILTISTGILFTMMVKYVIMHVVVSICMGVGLWFIYWAIDRIATEGKVQKRMYRSRYFAITMAITAILALADALRIVLWQAEMPGRPEETLNRPIVHVPLALSPAWIAMIVYYIIFNALMAYFLYLIVQAYIRNNKAPGNTLPSVRNAFCMAAFMLIGMTSLGVVIGILFWIVRQYSVHAFLVESYQRSKVVGIFFFGIGFLVPDWLFSYIAVPFLYLHRRRQREQDRLLAYLHKKLIAIVPFAHLDADDSIAQLRILVEIGDAQRVILNNPRDGEETLRLQEMTPEREAEIIFELLQHGRQLDGRKGPIPAFMDTRDHMLAVARCLQQLEQQGTAQLVPQLP